MVPSTVRIVRRPGLRLTTVVTVALASLGCTSAASADATCGAFTATNGTRITVTAKAMSCRPAIRIIKAFYNGTVPQTAVQYGNARIGFQTDERLKDFPGWLCHQSADAGFCFKGRGEAFYGESRDDGRGSVATSSAPRECGSSPLAVADPRNVSLAQACAVWQSALRQPITTCVGENPNQAFTPGAYPKLVKHSFHGWRISLAHGALKFSRGASSFMGEGSDAPPYPC